MNDTYIFLDTSSPVTFGQLGDRKGFNVFSWETRQDLAARIPALVSEMLERSAVSLEKIDCLGVCTGPGSLTGLRVGITFFRVLSQLMGKKHVGIDLFQWGAHTLQKKGVTGSVHIIVRAFLDKVFSQSFLLPAESFEVDPQLMDLQASLKLPGVWGISKSFPKAEKPFSPKNHASGGLCDSSGFPLLEPSPEALHEIMISRTGGAFSFNDLLNVKPLYIIPSQAEINLSKRSG